MKKRFLTLMFLLVIIISLLSACRLGDSGNGGGEGGTSGGSDSGDASDNLLMTPGTTVYVVSDKDNLILPSDLDLAIYKITGEIAIALPDDAAEETHEIILGDVDRPLSRKANNILRRMALDDFDEPQGGYVIYSDGTSVAIAYSCDEALDMAVENFIQGYLTDPADGKVSVESGTVAKENFSLYALYNMLDDEHRQTQWDALEKYVNELGYDGAGTVDALQQLYSLYSDKAYIWLANLWDPEAGGFYYSNSGRDTISFAPDLESTRQALDLIRYSGMSGSLASDLPKEMQNSMIEFVRSLYDPASGYYKHPQWDNLVTTDERLGRDVTNANTILGAFGATQGASSSSSSDSESSVLPAASMLTASLGGSSVASVSKVVFTAARPAHLESEEAFLKYLNSQNWNDSYTSGNRIAAQSYLIDKNGLMEVCLDFFDSIQNPDTGMWSPNRDDDAVNGFLKISAVYADYAPKYKRTINYASEAADTCIQVLLSDQAPSTVCWVYNVWYSIDNILGLLRTSEATAEDKALADKIQARLRKDAPLYIRTAYEKYIPFLKNDGSFSFTPKTSANMSQGMPVCVSNMNEGDVNATYISIISISGRIFSALGYKKHTVDIYTPNDLKVFLNTVTGLGEIIKTNSEFGGALKFNGSSAEGLFHSTNATELDVGPDEVADVGYAHAYVTEDDGDNVLVYGKRDVAVGFEPSISFRLIDGKGTRYVYETRIKFLGGEMTDGSWHTRFSMYGGGRFWYLLAYTLSDGSLALGSRNEPVAVLDADKWYTLRFEYYTDSAELATNKVCKIYVDGEYVGDGGTSGAAGNDASYYRLLMEFRAASTNVSYMLDDILTTTDDEAYVAPPPPDLNDATGSYYTDASIKSKRYDYDAEAPTLPNVSSNGSADISVTDGTLVFAKNTAEPVAAEDYIHFVNGFGDAFWNFSSKVTVIEFDLNYKDISVATPMKWRFGKDIVVSKNGDSLDLSYNYLGTSTVVPLDVSSGEWNNIRLEQYWYKTDAAGNSYSLIKIFVNDKYKGEFKTEYNSATYNFYIYLLKSETTASLTIDNLLLAHIDKPYVSEEVGDVTDPDQPPGVSDEEYVPSAEVLGVKGGADGIVVIMHDDGSVSSARLLDSLYEKYSLKGDVALVVNNVYNSVTASPYVDGVNFWKQLINTGRWNITNHSYTHSWWGVDNANGTLEKEIVDSQQILRELFTTQRVLTYAYPGFSSSVSEYGKEEVYKLAYELISEYYIGARDYEDGTSALDGIIWSDVGSHSMGETWYSTALNDIDLAAGGKLAVIFMHGVVETESDITDSSQITLSSMEKIAEKVSGYVEDGKIWNAFFEEAMLYLREAEGATVSISGDADSLTVELTDAMKDDETYNYPLTVRIEVPASWSYAKISQGDTLGYATAYAKDGKWVIDAEIVPDGGAAVVTPITKHDIPATEEDDRPLEEMLEEPVFDPGDASGDYYSDPENTGLRVDYDKITATIDKGSISYSGTTGSFLITDGALLFEDGDAETLDMTMKYWLAYPSDFADYESRCDVFEFDFMLNQSYGSYPIQIKLANVSYTIYYSKNYDSSYGTGYKLCMKVGGADIPLGTPIGEWSTIRFEHYYDAKMLKVYVNNEYVLDLATSEGSQGTPMIYLTSNERKSGSDADLYIDNVFVGHVDKAFVEGDPNPSETPDEGDGDGEVTDPETPPTTPDTEEPTDSETSTDPEQGGTETPEVISDAKGEYYLNTDIDGKRVDYDVITEIDTGSISYSGTTGSFSIVDGALMFEDGDAESKEMVAKYWLSYPTSYNCTVFEFDFKLNQAYSTYPIQIKIANQTYTIYYNNTYDSSYGTGFKLCMKVGDAYIPLGTPIGEWSTIRFEHYYDAEVLKVYVNNEYVLDLASAAGSEGTPMIYLTSLERGKASNADLYVDNVFVGHIEKTFVSGDTSAQ